ncbi:MAG TPA: S9 family peptidase [Gemmatimonadales bacterium]|nr:S9 family peptidase [Gemmatimonadales bacterium]
MSNPSRTLPALAVPPGGAEEQAQVGLGAAPALGEPVPPSARAIPTTQTVHGETRIDEYHWLRYREDPEVIAYLEAENRYTRDVMRHTEGLQECLYQEMRARIKETDLSVPERIDGWLYYTRTEAGGQYPIFCRRLDREESDEQVLLDQNLLAAGHDYFRMGAFEISPDHRLLAYSVDTSGAESFRLVVKDLETGALLDEPIGNCSPSAAWGNDSRTLFYVQLDSARRPCRLHRHRVGNTPATDVEVHFEADESFFIDVGRTRSRRWLVLDISSHSTSEIRVLEADRPEGEFRTVEPRRHGVEYGLTHHGDRFYLVTNDEAPNFRLVSAPELAPGRENWTPVLPYQPDIKLDSADAFRDHLVLWERHEGLRRIRVLTLATGDQHLVPFPEPVYTVWPYENPEFATTVLRFGYTSMVTPGSVIEYDLAARTWLVRKETPVLGYDRSRYRSERIFARAPDGARVPVSLAYRLPFEPDASRPLLLNGYGAYGVSFDPGFSSNLLSLLDRGFVVAIAHVRGGEELGRAWYESGKLLNKRNSFSDFIAVAEHLVREGYAAPDRLAIGGGSAGGLLMGAVTNLRPDLFRAVLAEVPFVDVVNTMLDASLPLTVIEYDEWGNPNDPEYYEYIRSYSPYDNVQSRDYPNILVTAGLNDPRVAYWEPAKWTARLRARKTDTNRLLLRTNMGAGHGGASGRYDFLREVAFKYAFLMEAMGG